jgi:hypothetical protein
MRRSAPLEPGRSIRLLLLATIVYCVAGYAFAARYGEPYPAIAMPGFKDGATKHGAFDCGKTEVIVSFAEGDTSKLHLRDLLTSIPETHRDSVAGWLFQPTTTRLASSQPGTFKRLAHRIFPSLARRALRHETGNHPTSDTKAWLKSRLSQIVPNRTVKTLRFRWYTEVHTEVNGWQSSSQREDAVYTVEL